MGWMNGLLSRSKGNGNGNGKMIVYHLLEYVNININQTIARGSRKDEKISSD